MDKNGISIIGLDRAGKSVITNYLATGILVKDFKPTLALNYSKIIFNGIKYPWCDAPGQQSLRSTWNKCLQIAMFVIYVLDISDSARYPEALDELTKVIKNPDLEGIPMVFLFHKIDMIKNKDDEMQAKLFFSEDFIQSFGHRELKFFDTSIFQLNTLDAVKEYITFHLCELTAALQACNDGTP